jgi:hypothetical protein
MCEAEAMSSRLLGAGHQDRRDHPDLSVSGAFGGRPINPSAGPHASRPAATSHSSRPSIGIV